MNDELIAEMKSLLQEKMEKDYKKGNTKRDAHPKCLGFLKANFTVKENIPEAFKTGVFKTAKTFKSWVRISNASGQVQSDENKDFRGFAIKLLGIKGERFTSEESHTQDFLFLSSPTMPLGTVKLFRDAVYYSIKWNPVVLALKLLFTGKAGILKALQTGKHHDTSPLDISYWSTTPFQLGNQKVKYKLVPTSKQQSKLPKQLTENYLTVNMQNHLNKSIATFDFYIQLYKDEKTTPIEDAGVEWEAENSPFIKIAAVEIPTQQFDTKARFDLAEQMSFSPANALTVHQPLGELNRARTSIYKFLSEFRHKRNGIKISEPGVGEYDTLK